MDPEIEVQECCACGSRRIRPYRRVGSFSIEKCHSCGLMWVPGVTQGDVDAFYVEDYFNNGSKMGYRDYLSDEANHRANARSVLRSVGEVKDLRGSAILDIGCAFGFLLDEARRFDVAGLYGLEINGQARAYAHEKLGLSKVAADSVLDGFKPDSFDVVFLMGTIEHHVSPGKILLEVRRVLKPGGVAVITTIDTRGFFPLFSFKPPEHLFYFSHDNIRLLLSRVGFTRVLVRPYFARYGMNDLLYRLKEFAFGSARIGAYRSAGRFFNFSVKIPTNEMLVIGIRP